MKTTNIATIISNYKKRTVFDVRRNKSYFNKTNKFHKKKNVGV